MHWYGRACGEAVSVRHSGVRHPAMHRNYNSVAIGFALLALGGCSRAPQITVSSSGTMPTSGTYIVIEGAPVEISPSVPNLLAQHGLTQSKTPSYIVQVSYAERPAGTGLLAPRGPGSQWLRRPDLHHKRRPIITLGISIADVADGRELYHASASGRLQADPGSRASFIQAIFPVPTRDTNQDPDQVARPTLRMRAAR